MSPIKLFEEQTLTKKGSNKPIKANGPLAPSFDDVLSIT